MCGGVCAVRVCCAMAPASGCARDTDTSALNFIHDSAISHREHSPHTHSHSHRIDRGRADSREVSAARAALRRARRRTRCVPLLARASARRARAPAAARARRSHSALTTAFCHCLRCCTYNSAHVCILFLSSLHFEIISTTLLSPSRHFIFFRLFVQLALALQWRGLEYSIGSEPA